MKEERAQDNWIFTIKPALASRSTAADPLSSTVTGKPHSFSTPIELPQSKSLSRILLPILAQVLGVPSYLFKFFFFLIFVKYKN